MFANRRTSCYPLNMDSSWTANKKYRVARRPQGNLLVVDHSGSYLLILANLIAVSLAREGLDEAIEAADALFPPEGWDYEPTTSTWTSEGWRVMRMDDGWLVHDANGDMVSQRLHPRAEQARLWCEIRADRVGINLRGPKPASTASA